MFETLSRSRHDASKLNAQVAGHAAEPCNRDLVLGLADSQQFGEDRTGHDICATAELFGFNFGQESEFVQLFVSFGFGR